MHSARFYSFAILYFLQALCFNVAWATPKVAIVSPPHHHAIVHRIEASLYASGPNHPTFIWVDPAKIEDYHLLHTCDCNRDLELIVTVGPKATRKVLESQPNAPVLAVLLYKHVFENLLCEFDISMEEDRRKVSAIYLDQPFSRSAQLADLLIATHAPTRRVGMVLGPSSSLELQRLESEAAAMGIQLNVIQIPQGASPVSALNHVLDDADVLLALPDQAVFNEQTARGMLLTAYRKKVPVVGYTQTYVKMGALASLFVTPKQVANQVADSISEILAAPEAVLPAPQLASYFSVTVNSHVAQLLKRGVLSEALLKQHIEDWAPLEEGI